MYDGGIFVFGSKIFHKDLERHAIFSLPLEITWKIFSYLDDRSLRTVSRTHKMWFRIITASKQLRKRLNKFELAIKLGSEKLAKFHRKNRRRLLKERGRNYVPLNKTSVLSAEKSVLKTIRRGEEFVVYTKRYKLF